MVNMRAKGMMDDKIKSDSARIRDAETYEKELNEALFGTSYTISIENKLDFPNPIEIKVTGVQAEYIGKRIELDTVKCLADAKFSEMRAALKSQIVEAYLKDPKAEIYVQKAIKNIKAAV